MIHELGAGNTIFNQFLSELRDSSVQKDSLRFRLNLQRIGEIFAYEISKEMNYVPAKVSTPLGMLEMNLMNEQPVLATILRAGLPLHQGLLNYFDKADSAFVSAYRKYAKNENFTIKLDYISSPNIDGRVLIVSDPMLATGGSLVASIRGLFEKGKPAHTHVVCALASDEGIAKVKRAFTFKNLTLWVGAIDVELTAKAFIVPGLGDAGDLAYGRKDDI
ncbi:MAG: uracil phosphoribosyltransferase [Bacteroidales bacterium]|jgi:uracil phosphoribosyltransferase|nr:uracil phosphoribosyltransferase [Bacteroidales bacterium]